MALRLIPRVDVLGAAAARTAAVSGLVVLAVAIVAGVVRALPWLVAPQVPFGVVLPLARGVLGVGLETALLCGPPIGWALAAARFINRGEARALYAIGVRPARLVHSTLIPATVFAALAGAAALVWGTEAAAPGRLARAMVARAKAPCEVATEVSTAQIPLFRATWVCFPGAAPRIAGLVPGTGSSMFSASGATISDDLRTVELSDMHALLGEGMIRVHAEHASFRNLAPFGRASNLGPWGRSAVLSLTGGLLALLGCWFVLRVGEASQPFALAIGAAGPVAALGALSWLERRTMPSVAYLLIPCMGAAALACAAWIGVGVLRIRARRRP